MQLIAEIYEEDSKALSTQGIQYDVRRAARAIVMNELGEIALMYAAEEDYHKLPGGGIEANEHVTDALVREMTEEVGADVEILDGLGIVIEYRNKRKFMQISYCYMCKVRGCLENPTFTEDELKAGFELQWLTLTEAIARIEQEFPVHYATEFMHRRDLALLGAAKEWIVRNKR
ncbi:NUDIX domain-containing protein [Paenibacillus albiflavus]|uniref:NUDIX domain-containing protein n=1 Tax=Paenibacillus albiflavus TaxID=2545760 RepID=A0A4V2WPG2_9BACL|nr:NUDIX domain-containing protein [Paenibacillus albiflavus]TCZ79252.1 NUDIX domain-containing protein [Paenibacillus albiflavus]